MLALLQVTEPAQVNWVPALLLLILWTGVWYWICTFLRVRLAALPGKTRVLAPWVTYALLIPGVNLFANFFVLLGISHAYTKSFAAFGRELPGRESGRVEAAVYSACFCLGVYPMSMGSQALVWMIALGSVILYLFKIHSLGERFARIQVHA